MKNIKQEIAKILVKWNMPTRQVAINEIAQLLQGKPNEPVLNADFEPIGTVLSVTGQFMSAHALPNSTFNTSDKEIYENVYLLVFPLNTGETIRFIVHEELALVMAEHIKSKMKGFIAVAKDE